MKKTPQKLHLNRETVRGLSKTEMTAAAGGLARVSIWWDESCWRTCATCYQSCTFNDTLCQIA